MENNLQLLFQTPIAKHVIKHDDDINILINILKNNTHMRARKPHA